MVGSNVFLRVAILAVCGGVAAWPGAGRAEGTPAAASALPAPVHGVSFDEWTSANARLAARGTLPEILSVLGISEAEWREVNAAFTRALQTGDPGGPVFARYGEVFANPNGGRFAGTGSAPKAGTIDSFEEYARIQAEMTAAREAGQDPVKVLQERFGLTPYDYSQQGARWVKVIADAGMRGDQAAVARQNKVLAVALAEARRRYGVTGRD